MPGGKNVRTSGRAAGSCPDGVYEASAITSSDSTCAVCEIWSWIPCVSNLAASAALASRPTTQKTSSPRCRVDKIRSWSEKE